MADWESTRAVQDISGEKYALNGWNYGTSSDTSIGSVNINGKSYPVRGYFMLNTNAWVVKPFYDRNEITTGKFVLIWKLMEGAFFYVYVTHYQGETDAQWHYSYRVGIANNPNPTIEQINNCGYGFSSSLPADLPYTERYLALVYWWGSVGVVTCDAAGVTKPRPEEYCGFTVRVDKFLQNFGLTPPYVDDIFSPQFGDASDAGGYSGGTFDDSSDTISLPDTPTLGVSNAGFINVYNPSAGALANFGEDLFPDFTPIEGGDDTTQAIVNLGKNVTNAINMFTNSRLIDYIIDCHILPVKPEAQTAEAIKVGFRTFDQLAPKITTDYFDVDCGKLSVGEYYGNFIDYGGFTQAKLYLPFIGFIDIEPEYWQSGTLQVIYRFNVIDGSFMAFVLSTSSKSKLKDTVIGQYGGNACVHIPITGLNYSSMISGVVSGAAGVLSNVGSNVGGATSSAVQVMTSAPSMQSSNAYNATTAFLGVRTPYLLIERSVSHFSRNYANEKGIPSQISMPFKDLKGFTTATVEHLNGFEDVTEEELDEIKELLANGVIF